MKYLIPAVAVLALGVCALSRRETAETLPRRAAAAPAVEVHGVPGIAEAARDAKPRTGDLETVSAPAKANPPTTPVVSAPLGSEMLQVLKDRLELTPAQEAQIAEALRTRAKELLECHDAWRETGVFVPREYGLQLLRMKESWYRSIDRVLDSEQHRTFDGLVADGFFRPGTSFSADLMTMSVLR